MPSRSLGERHLLVVVAAGEEPFLTLDIAALTCLSPCMMQLQTMLAHSAIRDRTAVIAAQSSL